MQNRKIIYITLFFLFFLSVVLAIIIFSIKKPKDIKVVFFNVGQGDSILIEEGSNQILIDGGKNGRLLLEQLGRVMPFWDRKIEAIIVTHPDLDHYGGFMDLLDAYHVENIIKTDLTKVSKEWQVFEEKIIAEKVDKITAIYGLNISFPNGASMKTIYPFSKVEESSDSNTESVAMKLDFGENSFLFTGDIPNETEAKLINAGIDLDVDVLKIAHHGSKNSSSAEFLEASSPDDAIISVGAKNLYKHPHGETLTKLKERLVRTWRTDEDGNIFYVCKLGKKCEAYSE